MNKYLLLILLITQLLAGCRQKSYLSENKVIIKFPIEIQDSYGKKMYGNDSKIYLSGVKEINYDKIKINGNYNISLDRFSKDENGNQISNELTIIFSDTTNYENFIVALISQKELISMYDHDISEGVYLYTWINHEEKVVYKIDSRNMSVTFEYLDNLYKDPKNRFINVF